MIEIEAIHRGIAYRDALRLIHQAVNPSLYFEIGVGSGGSLSQATCPTICVDPKCIPTSASIQGKKECHLYQMTSDEFFQLAAIGRSLFWTNIDIAFLDGLHWFEVLLRDFINTERYCLEKSIIVLHDCIPYSFEVAERHHRPELRANLKLKNQWAGDVWKIIPILRELRPEIQIVSFDCPPTGLVACTNLNPNSKILSDAYSQTVHRFRNLTLKEFGIQKLIEQTNLVTSSKLSLHMLRELLSLSHKSS